MKVLVLGALTVVMLLAACDRVSGKEAGCAELSAQYQAALSAPAPQLPSDARAIVIARTPYTQAANEHRKRIDDAKAAYERSCR